MEIILFMDIKKERLVFLIIFTNSSFLFSFLYSVIVLYELHFSSFIFSVFISL